eukprot:EST47053.1 Hypothetical protein SS50377_12900 [Spironucleus salmonicida]
MNQLYFIFFIYFGYILRFHVIQENIITIKTYYYLHHPNDYMQDKQISLRPKQSDSSIMQDEACYKVYVYSIINFHIESHQQTYISGLVLLMLSIQSLTRQASVPIVVTGRKQHLSDTSRELYIVSKKLYSKQILYLSINLYLIQNSRCLFKKIIFQQSYCLSQLLAYFVQTHKYNVSKLLLVRKIMFQYNVIYINANYRTLNDEKDYDQKSRDTLIISIVRAEQ